MHYGCSLKVHERVVEKVGGEDCGRLPAEGCGDCKEEEEDATGACLFCAAAREALGPEDEMEGRRCIA